MAPTARLAQPAERKALNLVVEGSSPTVRCTISGEKMKTTNVATKQHNINENAPADQTEPEQ